MRGSRQFTKRVEVWQTTASSDGFGGNIAGNDLLISVSWAKVETMGITGRFANRTTDIGVTETNQGVLFTFRKRKDLNYNSLNQYLIYRGVKYVISSFPDNINFNDAYIEIVAVRETQEGVSTPSELLAKALAIQHTIRVNEDMGFVEDFDCLVTEIQELL